MAYLPELGGNRVLPLDDSFADFQLVVHPLVIGLGVPIKVHSKLFHFSEYHPPEPLLDMVKPTYKWSAYISYAISNHALYFPEINDQHNLVLGKYLDISSNSTVISGLPFYVHSVLP